MEQSPPPPSEVESDDDDAASLASSTISVQMTKAAVLQRTLKWAGYRKVQKDSGRRFQLEAIFAYQSDE
jgi:hypothetical protein